MPTPPDGHHLDWHLGDTASARRFVVLLPVVHGHYATHRPSSLRPVGVPSELLHHLGMLGVRHEERN